MTINILHLYPNEMNTYGDHGNVLTLRKRLEWHGYTPKVTYHHPGDKLDIEADIIVGGGGQDSAQADVQTDILKIGADLHKLAEQKVPMLMVCGMYQLFGHRYITNDGLEVRGISVFDAETVAGQQRMIGNVMIKTDFGDLLGFENHSGQTKLGASQKPFGKVLRGGGNNGQDKTEGAWSHNVFGTYLHGPILPNNPIFTDHLISLAAKKQNYQLEPKIIDDSFAELARSKGKNRKY
jgi:CobQ-like glutamine amidotransferase family enzyme